MKEKLRILILEDNAADANLMERVLKKARISFSARCVEGKEDLVKELEEFPPDLILADYKLPGFTALDALKIIEKRVPVTPVIVVTGAVGEEEAAKCIKSGAWDYLLKQNLEHLPAAVDRAIEEKRIIEEKKEAEKTLKNVVKLWDSTFNAISDGICLLTVDRKILKCNNSMAEFLGMPLDEMTGKICCELLHGTIEPVEECPVTRMKATRKRETEVLQFRDRWISVVCDPVTDEAGALAGAVHITRDITEIKKAEEVSKKEYKILEGIFEATLAGYWDWRVQENEEYFSPTFKKMFGYEAHELPNKPETWQKLIFPEDLPKVKENFDQHIKSHGEMPYYNEARYRHKDGSTVWVICAGRVIEWGPGGEALRMVGCHVDITERKKAEEAVLKEKQFSDFLIENLP
ncbi:MAG: PAS domain S-box protein, partial [Candidatus Omnitrophota bacterium]